MSQTVRQAESRTERDEIPRLPLIFETEDGVRSSLPKELLERDQVGGGEVFGGEQLVQVLHDRGGADLVQEVGHLLDLHLGYLHNKTACLRMCIVKLTASGSQELVISFTSTWLNLRSPSEAL